MSSRRRRRERRRQAGEHRHRTDIELDDQAPVIRISEAVREPLGRPIGGTSRIGVQDPVVVGEKKLGFEIRQQVALRSFRRICPLRRSVLVVAPSPQPRRERLLVGADHARRPSHHTTSHAVGYHIKSRLLGQLRTLKSPRITRDGVQSQHQKVSPHAIRTSEAFPHHNSVMYYKVIVDLRAGGVEHEHVQVRRTEIRRLESEIRQRAPRPLRLGL
jgi:hypothetical protein